MNDKWATSILFCPVKCKYHWVESSWKFYIMKIIETQSQVPLIDSTKHFRLSSFSVKIKFGLTIKIVDENALFSTWL